MAAQSTLQSTDPLAALFARYADQVRGRFRHSSTRTRLLATITLLLSIIGSGYGSYNWLRRRARDRAQGRRLLRRNSGIRGKDGSRTIYVPDRDSRTSKVTIHPTKPTTFDAHRRLFLNPPAPARTGDGESQIPPPATKPGLNLAFLHQFLSLGSIMVPRWNSKETGLLMSHGVFLLLRTYLSLLIARLDGEIVRDLVAGKGRAFLWGIVKWCGIGTLASYTNAMIKFLQSKVSIAFRTRLTRYIHDLYLTDNNNYYKLMNLDGGIGQGADQFITQDLTVFCSASAALYSSIGKPLVDLCVFNYQLYLSLGPLALSGLCLAYFSTATALRKLSPPFGKLKAVEGKREGDFRGLHSRILANAEEISFYGGADVERVFLTKSFKDLQRWMEGIYSLRIRYNMVEDVILKYAWSAFGYLITSFPVFLPAWGGGDLVGSADGDTPPAIPGRERSRMKDFITNKRLMLSLADAGGRMMYSIKDISELAGYTSRVYTLISTLHRVHAGAYYPPRGSHAELYSMADVQGTTHNGFDGVRLENVPVVAPSLYPRGGDELIASLSFIVHSGEHLLISGSNGVGKSAIPRIIAGLWPVYRGLVSRPRPFGLDGIMFLPQRPYLSVGTLRDQVIYPHTAIDMYERGASDSDIQQILDDARLGYLPSREGGWDVRKEWKDVFSGGEKQRMAIARLLYHEPNYAFLDEGTSAVSSDVEGLLYEQAKKRGTTLVTISTRASLKKYHTYHLALGVDVDEEQWVFERIGTEKEKLGVERELVELRKRLDKVDEWKARRELIEKELGSVWVQDGELEPPSYQKVVDQVETVEAKEEDVEEAEAKKEEQLEAEEIVQPEAEAEAPEEAQETQEAQEAQAQ